MHNRINTQAMSVNKQRMPEKLMTIEEQADNNPEGRPWVDKFKKLFKYSPKTQRI